MAKHDVIAPLFQQGIFFADVASPWQRGTNENTNGLLRQYFPKGNDLRKYDPNYLRSVEELLNHRPRKVLGWLTPSEVYYADVGF